MGGGWGLGVRIFGGYASTFILLYQLFCIPQLSWILLLYTTTVLDLIVTAMNYLQVPISFKNMLSIGQRGVFCVYLFMM